MIKLAVFTGEISNISWEKLLSVLSQVYGNERVKPKSKLTGEEIFYEDDDMELYFYSKVTDSMSESFLCNVSYVEDMDTLLGHLKQLTELFKEAGAGYALDHYLESEDGDLLSDTQTLTHLPLER